MNYDNQLFGFIVKERRKAKGWSLDNFSDDTKINKIALNRIELCKLDYKDFPYDRILQLLEIDFDEVKKANQMAICIFKKLYKKAMYMNEFKDEERQILEIISSQSRKCGLIQEVFTLFISVRNQDLKKAKKQVQFIDRNIIYLENDLLCLYYSLKSTFYYSIEKYDEALLELKKIDIYSEEEYQKAVLFDYFGMIYKAKKEWIESLNYSYKAIDIYNNTYNYQRALYVKMDVGNIYVRLKKYDSGVNVFLNILEDNEVVAINSQILASVYYNLAWCYLLKKEYDNVIDYAEKSDAICFKIGNCKHKALAYYELGLTDKAMKSIDEGLMHLSKTSSDACFLKMIQALIVDYEQSITKMIETYNKFVEIDNEQGQEIVLEYIIDYYSKHQCYSKLCIYQSKMIKMLKPNFYAK